MPENCWCDPVLKQQFRWKAFVVFPEQVLQLQAFCYSAF